MPMQQAWFHRNEGIVCCVYVFFVYFYVNVVRVHARVIHYIYDLHEYYTIFLSSFLETTLAPHLQFV